MSVSASISHAAKSVGRAVTHAVNPGRTSSPPSSTEEPRDTFDPSPEALFNDDGPLTGRALLSFLKQGGDEDYGTRQGLVAQNRNLGTDEAYTRDELPTSKPERYQYLADPDNYVPERQAVQNDILGQQFGNEQQLSEALSGPNGEKNLILLRGNSGAGKTYGIQHQPGLDIPNTDGIINPDAIKSQLIGADGGAATFNQTAREGAAVTNRAIDQLFDNNLSGIVDKRFGTPDEIAPLLERAKAAGYNTTVLDFDTPLATSAERVLDRPVGGDSPIVPFDKIAEGYQQARGEREAVAGLDNIDNYKLFQDGSLIAQRDGGGELQQLDPAAYNEATTYSPDEIDAARQQYGPALEAKANQTASDLGDAGEAASAADGGALSRVGGLLSNPIVEKAGGALGVVGGAVQTTQGIGELEHGKYVDGVADTSGGLLNAAGGAALLAGAPELAPFAFGAAGVADGTRDLIHGISSGNAEEIGVGSAKTVGGGLLIAGGALAATGVGVVPGAIVAGAGAVLYGGAELFQDRAAIGHAIGDAASTVGHAVGHAASDVGHAVGHAASDVGHFISSLNPF